MRVSAAYTPRRLLACRSMWRGLPISTWLLLAVSVGAGPALVLLRWWSEGRRRRGRGSARSGAA